MAPRRANRVFCYCRDCQSFLHALARADLLDEHGGSDIIQVAPAFVDYERGTERIAGLRLSLKGLYRWYADCCQTPLGNTAEPKLPFVGIHARTFDHPDSAFGPPLGGYFGKDAVGTPPRGRPVPIRACCCA